MIKSFKDKDTELIFSGKAPVKIPADIAQRALRRMIDLNSAQTITDLRIPPSNRLEQLKSKRKHQHSIRVNDQYRICFTWKDGDAYEVEFTDYH